MSGPYDYALSVTSQFPFCSLPLRLDSYSTCQFSCRYCFASARGGSRGPGRIQVADPAVLQRRLDRLAATTDPHSLVDEFLTKRVPIHFGGMSDPFMPMERERKVSLDLLRVLHRHQYPTVLSTKSTLCAESPYLDLLADGKFVVQISIPTLSDSVGRRVDVGAPPPSERVALIRRLSEAGIATACRIQPVLPGAGSQIADLIEACADAGARQVAVEHLKLGVENNRRRAALSASLNMDVVEFYQSVGSKRIGREWVLPVSQRIERIIALRAVAHRVGLKFGAADNDLLHLSDGQSCCSSIDLFGFGTAYKFTFTQAIHAHHNGQIALSSISDEWRPSRSVARYVNSRSRLGTASVEQYVRDAWNGSQHGASPRSYYGVESTGSIDGEGFSIYQISQEAINLMARSLS